VSPQTISALKAKAASKPASGGKATKGSGKKAAKPKAEKQPKTPKLPLSKDPKTPPNTIKMTVKEMNDILSQKFDMKSTMYLNASGQLVTKGADGKSTVGSISDVDPKVAAMINQFKSKLVNVSKG
jgi:hypothetical protein